LKSSRALLINSPPGEVDRPLAAEGEDQMLKKTTETKTKKEKNKNLCVLKIDII